MDFPRVKFHLKIILDGVKFIFGTVFGEFLAALYLIAALKLTIDKVSRLGIRWNLNSPIRHYQQLSAVFVYVYIFLFTNVTTGMVLIFFLYYLNNYGRAALVFYWIYIYRYHRTTFSIGDEAGCGQLRSNFISRLARSYFPVELVKTVDLEPNRNYILACFPHGIMGIGSCYNMSFDVSNWLALFPRIRPKIATLDLNFLLPLSRFIFLRLGIISSSKDSLLHQLRQSNDENHPDNRDGFTSNAIALVIGGAKEAENSTPGVYKLTIKNRKGFVKLAILSGSSIVPSFSFGEVELLDQVFVKTGSYMDRLQQFIRRKSGVWLAFTSGQGFFQDTFGILPRKRRVMFVVGSPIDVVQSDEPDAKYVDEIHKKVIEAIISLFETHKKSYSDNYENVKLIIT